MRYLHSHNSWRWYGYAGHLIVSRDCDYHLNTRVGNFVVSTVGAYYPDDQVKMKIIGSGKKDFFETCVFRCTEEVDGYAVVDYLDIDSKRYEKSIKAESGHYTMCWKWHFMGKEIN
jgi:hypothetical protein